MASMRIFPANRSGWELAEAVCGDGQNDDVGVAYDVFGCRRGRAGGEHVDRQRNVVGRARSRDSDVVAGRDGGAGERRAELARADDAEAQIVGPGAGGGRRSFAGLGRRDGDHEFLTPAASVSCASEGASSSPRTRGITSRPYSSIVAIRW